MTLRLDPFQIRYCTVEPLCDCRPPAKDAHDSLELTRLVSRKIACAVPCVVRSWTHLRSSLKQVCTIRQRTYRVFCPDADAHGRALRRNDAGRSASASAAGSTATPDSSPQEIRRGSTTWQGGEGSGDMGRGWGGGSQWVAGRELPVPLTVASLARCLPNSILFTMLPFHRAIGLLGVKSVHTLW